MPHSARCRLKLRIQPFAFGCQSSLKSFLNLRLCTVPPLLWLAGSVWNCFMAGRVLCGPRHFVPEASRMHLAHSHPASSSGLFAEVWTTDKEGRCWWKRWRGCEDVSSGCAYNNFLEHLSDQAALTSQEQTRQVQIKASPARRTQINSHNTTDNWTAKARRSDGAAFGALNPGTNKTATLPKSRTASRWVEARSTTTVEELSLVLTGISFCSNFGAFRLPFQEGALLAISWPLVWPLGLWQGEHECGCCFWRGTQHCPHVGYICIFERSKHNWSFFFQNFFKLATRFSDFGIPQLVRQLFRQVYCRCT